MVKAIQEFAVQFGHDNPFTKPDFGLAESHQALQASTKLQGRLDSPGTRDGRVNSRRCYAASTVQSGVTEMAMVSGFNTVLQGLVASGELQRTHPHLAELGGQFSFEYKPIAHNEADFFAVQRRPGGDVLHYAAFQQQAARYLPSKGRSAAARSAMLTPRNPTYSEQPAAAEVEGFVVFVHHTVGVGSAGDVMRMLDSRGAGAGGSAGGSEEASGEEEMWEEGQGGVQECLLLLAEEVEGEVEAETSAAEAAAAGAGLPAEDIEPEEGGEAGSEAEDGNAAPAQQQQQEEEEEEEGISAGSGSEGESEEGQGAGTSSGGAPEPAGPPRTYRYSELLEAGAVVDCSRPADAVVAILQLVHDGKVSPQDPQRSLDMGLPPPAVLRNEKQRPIARALLQLAGQLRSALGEGFDVFLNLLEATAPGLHIALPPGWEPPPISTANLAGLLRLRYPEADVSSLATLLKECGGASGRLPGAAARIAAMLSGEAALPSSWAELRALALLAVRELKEQHLQLAREASNAAGAGPVAGEGGGEEGGGEEPGEEGPAPRGPGSKREAGGGGAAPRKKQRLDWTAQEDLDVLDRIPAFIREGPGGKKVINFDGIGQEMGRRAEGIRVRIKHLLGGQTTAAFEKKGKAAREKAAAAVAAAAAAAAHASPQPAGPAPSSGAPQGEGGQAPPNGSAWQPGLLHGPTTPSAVAAEALAAHASPQPAGPAPPGAAQQGEGGQAPPSGSAWHPGQLHRPQASSAAAEPRLAGRQSLFMRMVGVTEGGGLALAHSMAGALYTFHFDQTIIRWQLLAAVSHSTGRTYLTNGVAANSRGLLGTSSGIGARGTSALDEASLEPFEVTSMLHDPAALRAEVLPLLLGVSAQGEARSALAAICQLPMLATPTALHFAGVSPFKSGWASGCAESLKGELELNYEAWAQTQGERCEGFWPAFNLAVATGMMHMYQIYQQMAKVSDRARKAGIELDRTQPERSTSWEAKRLFGGDDKMAAAIRDAKKRFIALMDSSELTPTAGVGRTSDWSWVTKMNAKCPGVKDVVDILRK